MSSKSLVKDVGNDRLTEKEEIKHLRGKLKGYAALGDMYQKSRDECKSLTKERNDLRRQLAVFQERQSILKQPEKDVPMTDVRKEESFVNLLKETNDDAAGNTRAASTNAEISSKELGDVVKPSDAISGIAEEPTKDDRTSDRLTLSSFTHLSQSSSSEWLATPADNPEQTVPSLPEDATTNTPVEYREQVHTGGDDTAGDDDFERICIAYENLQKEQKLNKTVMKSLTEEKDELKRIVEHSEKRLNEVKGDLESLRIEKLLQLQNDDIDPFLLQGLKNEPAAVSLDETNKKRLLSTILELQNVNKKWEGHCASEGQKFSKRLIEEQKKLSSAEQQLHESEMLLKKYERKAQAMENELDEARAKHSREERNLLTRIDYLEDQLQKQQPDELPSELNTASLACLSERDLKEDVVAMRQQLKVYLDDFHTERKDRERLKGDFDNLQEKVDQLQRKNSGLRRKKDNLQLENSELKGEIEHLESVVMQKELEITRIESKQRSHRADVISVRPTAPVPSLDRLSATTEPQVTQPEDEEIVFGRPEPVFYGGTPERAMRILPEADEPSGPPPAYDPRWLCRVCTLENAEEADRCIVCNATKGTTRVSDAGNIVRSRGVPRVNNTNI